MRVEDLGAGGKLGVQLLLEGDEELACALQAAPHPDYTGVLAERRGEKPLEEDPLAARRRPTAARR